MVKHDKQPKRPTPRMRTCGVCGQSYDPTNDAQSRKHAQCVENERKNR